jgi:hypothetical protein
LTPGYPLHYSRILKVIVRSPLPTAALLLIVVATSSLAGDHPIAGDHLLLTDPSIIARRSARFLAVRDLEIDPTRAADPRTVGATIEFFGEGSADGGTGPMALGPSHWTGTGRPRGSIGYRYLDFTTSAGIVPGS